MKFFFLRLKKLVIKKNKNLEVSIPKENKYMLLCIDKTSTDKALLIKSATKNSEIAEIIIAKAPKINLKYHLILYRKVNAIKNINDETVINADSLRRNALQMNWYIIKKMVEKTKITLESILLPTFEKNLLAIKASKIIPNKFDMYNPNFTTS